MLGIKLLSRSYFLRLHGYCLLLGAQNHRTAGLQLLARQTRVLVTRSDRSLDGYAKVGRCADSLLPAIPWSCCDSHALCSHDFRSRQHSPHRALVAGDFGQQSIPSVSHHRRDWWAWFFACSAVVVELIDSTLPLTQFSLSEGGFELALYGFFSFISVLARFTSSYHGRRAANGFPAA